MSLSLKWNIMEFSKFCWVKYLSGTPSAAGLHSREEGCVEGAMLWKLICLAEFTGCSLSWVFWFSCEMCGSKLFYGGRFLCFFPFEAVTWHTIFIILSVQNLSLDRPGASILPPWNHFVSLGTPQRTMEGHMGAQNRIFSDFEWVWDPILEVFWALAN